MVRFEHVGVSEVPGLGIHAESGVIGMELVHGPAQRVLGPGRWRGARCWVVCRGVGELAEDGLIVGGGECAEDGEEPVADGREEDPGIAGRVGLFAAGRFGFGGFPG